MGEQGVTVDYKDTIGVLRWATESRLSIKAEQAALEARLNEVNAAAKNALQEAGLTQWADNVGTLSIKAAYETATLKKDKLIFAMLRHGVYATDIDEIIKEGTEIGTRAATLEFRVKAGD